MESDEKKIKYLEMIQSIINRMEVNSFQLKILMITLFSALLLFSAETDILEYEKSLVVCIVIVITIVFWYLDSYYLSLQRGLRNLYTKVIKTKNEADIEFFKIEQVKFEKGKEEYTKTNIFCCLFSKSTFPLYIPIITIFIYVITFYDF